MSRPDVRRRGRHHHLNTVSTILFLSQHLVSQHLSLQGKRCLNINPQAPWIAHYPSVGRPQHPTSASTLSSQHRLNTCFPVSTVGVSTPVLLSQHLPLKADLCLNVNPYTLFEGRTRSSRVALGGPGTYRFFVIRVPGPCMCSHNVLNDLTITPSTERVQIELQLA